MKLTMNDRLPPADILPFIIYVILLLYLGWRARRKGADQQEYLLSGRSLSTPAFVATLVTTWYGGILGIGEFAYTYGVSVWFVFGLPYYLFAVLFALFLASKVRRADNYSIPDMFYRKYARPAGLLGSIFIIFMTSPAPYILTLAILLQHIFGLNFVLSIIIGTIFSIIYVYSGGFRSVVATDRLQFFFMFSGFILLFVFLLSSSVPIDQLSNRLDTERLSWHGNLGWQNLVVWFLIASWTFIDPGFHQRCAAAQSPATAKKGVLLSVAFWFVFDMLTMLSGLYAFVLLPDTEPLMAFPALGDYILPPFIKGIFFTGMLAVVMSTIDSFTFLSALTFGRDIFWRLGREKSEETINPLVRLGLILTAVIAIALIVGFPSVIELWYNLGSLFIPPLLLPLLGAYFSGIRISAKATAVIMAGSFIISAGLFMWGQIHSEQGIPRYPLGVEPFFPGMACSLAGYGIMMITNKVKCKIKL